MEAVEIERFHERVLITAKVKRKKSKKEEKNLRSAVMRMYELYVTARTCFRVTLHIALRFFAEDGNLRIS